VAEKPEESSAGAIQSVAVAFDILEELSRSSAPVGVTELARRLGQTKARVHRHLANLRSLGFVSQDESSERYQLGWKIYRLGMSVAENFSLRRVAHPHVRRLSEDTGQTALMAMPANAEIIVIDSVQSSHHIVITVRPGAVIPASSSALGRAILAFASDDMRKQVLSQPMSRLTESTLVEPATIEARLAEVREKWYAVAINERLFGIAALAAPVFDDHDRLVGAVGLIASQSAISLDPDPELVLRVQEAARRISAELRSSTWDTRRPVA